MVLPPTGFLRRYDDDLVGALELVVRDLLTAGYDRAAAQTLTRRATGDRLEFGIEEAGGETALWVIERLQEDLLEELPSHVWPACPEHRSHPLWIDRIDPDARWTCIASGRRYARLGELSSFGDDLRGDAAST